MCEKYGKGIEWEGDFVNHLTRMGTTKIWPILAEIVDEDKYQQMIYAERYDFLRTKELFNKCMDIAYDQHHWEEALDYGPPYILILLLHVSQHYFNH